MLASSIKVRDNRAELISHSSLIIWDELPMANRAVLSCVNEICQDIMHNTADNFGGKTFLLAGDFRQTCPVIKGGSRARIVDASVKSSPLWPSFTIKRLTQPCRNAEDPDFAAFVDAIGDGAIGPCVDLNFLNPRCTTSPEDLIAFTYPPDILSDPLAVVKRSILAPRNDQVNYYNAKVLGSIDGIERTYDSSDSLKECKEQNIVPPAAVLDFAAQTHFPGIPDHRINIKTNGVYRLLRNFSIDEGLVKNARVEVVDVGRHIVTVKLLPIDSSQEIRSENILIPRITFSEELYSKYTLLRRQFPLAPAYATTFNSCQGLTLDRAGIDLTVPVFSHGQLYTALSRVRNREHVCVCTADTSHTTMNVTYDEILL